MFLAVLTLLINIVLSLRGGSLAGENPWEAWTLEWAASSPPAEENFHELPPIRSRRPLWDDMHPEHADWLPAGPNEGRA